MHYDSLLDCLAEAEQQAIAKNAPPVQYQRGGSNIPQEFLEILWPEPQSGVFVLFTRDDRPENHPYDVDEEWDQLGDQALAFDQSENVFFAVGIQDMGSYMEKARTADGVAAIPGLWCDIDVQVGKHVKERLPASFDEAIEFANSLRWKPSVIVNSGGGLHCYWLFKEAWVFNSAEERTFAKLLSKRFNDYVIAEGKKRGWDLDYVGDLARVLRLPGTRNHKTDPPKPVVILEHDPNRRYTHGDFAEINVYSAPQNHKTCSSSKVSTTGSIPNGKRNTALTSIAGSLRKQGLEREAIEAKLLEINQQRCSSSLPVEEVLTIARSVSSYSKGTQSYGATSAPDDPDLTECGNGERLVNRHGDTIRYNAKGKHWLIWDGTRWANDERLEIERKAEDTAKAIKEEAASVLDGEQRRKILLHAERAQTTVQLNSMITRARTRPGIAVIPEDFDQDTMLFNCQNGVFDLEAGRLLPHDPKRMISKIAPITYDPQAQCPLWMKFLDRIMNGDSPLIEFLQKAVGYTLSGSITEQAFFFLYGTGCNGKSVFLETIHKLVGEYGQQADFSTFLVRQGESPRNDVARLKSARFVTASEMNAGKRLDMAFMKQSTGGDRLTARFLFSEFFEFVPEFKLFLAANHKPEITSQGDSIWRRVRLIPFTVRIPDQERDPKLALKLGDELPGILNWALEGGRKWLAEGLGCPKAVEAATQEYREDEDPLAEFLSQCCTLKSSGKASIASLYRAYTDWCSANNETPYTKKKFGECLVEKGFARGRDKTSRYFAGIEVNQKEEDEPFAG